MSILSITFPVFLAFTLIAYYSVPKRMQWRVLLAASLIFYTLVGTRYLPVIFGLILVSFLGATALSDANQKCAQELAGADKGQKKQIRAQYKKRNRRTLTLTVIAVISVLAFLKYANFVLGNVNLLTALFGISAIPSLQLILPLGLSFYTFQIVAYLVDIYRGQTQAEHNLLRYALFVLFFPQLTEGPIARYHQLAPQFFAPKQFQMDTLRRGAELMLWGYFKKMVIADRLALFVNTVYGNVSDYSGPVLLLATALFSLQMYADFSGCMDIVTGASELFGIRLMKNFDHPYFSKTIPEFWRRWHISLSSWFRDYVFYPLSSSKLFLKINKKSRGMFGNRAGRILSSCFPILIVWMLTGLWHGAAWTYVAWGLCHGGYIMCGMIFAPATESWTRKLRIRTESRPWRLFQILRTFFLCTLARVFFRADNISEAFSVFAKMFGKWSVPGGLLSLGLDGYDMVAAAVALLMFLAVSLMQERFNIREKINAQQLPVRWGIYFCAVFAVIVFGVYGASNSGTEFIYEKY